MLSAALTGQNQFKLKCWAASASHRDLLKCPLNINQHVPSSYSLLQSVARQLQTTENKRPDQNAALKQLSWVIPAGLEHQTNAEGSLRGSVDRCTRVWYLL